MRSFPWHTWLVALVLSACAGAGQPLYAQMPDLQPLDAVIQASLKAWEAPGVAVVIVQGEKVLYLKGFGVRQIGGKTPIDGETTFAISSCTKAFTSLALAMLVDEGKLNWDDPVRKHVPFFHLHDPLADGQVVLRDLLCHRTGVAGHDILLYDSTLSPEEQIRRIALLKPSGPFRSTFLYQNMMVMAAGHAVGTASGTPWGDFVQQRIFKPLGMTGASCTNTAVLRSANYAHGHRRQRDGTVVEIPWLKYDQPNPAVSINASARDLAKWLSFQLGDGTHKGDRLVSTRNLLETHLPQMVIRMEADSRATHPFTNQMNYGLGWVIQDYRGLLLVSHGGVIDGQRAHITLIPKENIGLAILTNLHATRMNLALNYQLIDRLFGFKHKDWDQYFLAMLKGGTAAEEAAQRQRAAQRQPGTKPSHPLTAFVGSYEDPAYGTVRIEQDGDGLVWCWRSFRCPLEHYHYDTFTVKNERLQDPLLVFTLGSDGEVNGLRMPGDVDFKRGPKKE